ncbi:phosphoesterase [Rhodococcus sp. D2-41]|uniref:alkaline phosphatase family protein n=1 Tax=Speluncibacter jeojiensis TaxID=2710754 RepID=UPI00240EF454|nr:alkaline phosphatase family protein [Rhodococcus sp. D2-41]MDG3010640.1 phosphoesterase [Rhodococcus sp. D2-41]
MRLRGDRRGGGSAFLAGLGAAVLIGGVTAATATASGAVGSVGVPGGSSQGAVISSTGLKRGQIKHVWLIILENKSYDATFTGLNQNSYLWKTLPAQGALLKNYYGTGHSSQDNYLSMVSGQAPQEDTQSDCSVKDFDFGSNATVVRSGPNRGQVASAANAAQPSGANAPNGANGCTYPTAAPTLFNQLDAAGKTWKGYAQDLRDQPGREDAVCGGPGTAENNPTTNPTYMSATAQHPLPAGVTSLTGAQPNDQYVAKHFPFPWFHSITGTVGPDGTTAPGLTTPVQGGNDCDVAHVANLDSAAGGLFHDLQHASTTPAFSWITPNNCSDAHDAVCRGNNLSGAFGADGEPVYQQPNPDPEVTTPRNHIGGLYAADKFLEYYIPMIEKSPAFEDGGLIDVTFDEGTPPFTYSGNSFNNADAYGPTRGDRADATSGIAADAAGENLFGRNVAWEPTGPNSTLGADAGGRQLYPGPGNNAFIDRPPACAVAQSPDDCVPGIVRGGSGDSPGPRTDTVTAGTTSSFVQDRKILADDTGRIVTDTADRTGPGAAGPIPPNTFVGTVSDTGPLPAKTGSDPVTDGSFQLVDAAGNPVTPTGPVTTLTLSGEGAPGHLTPGETADPLYDADDPTPGGGVTGSVLISPLITPGTVSTTYYNHYSWLRTMEDVFGVGAGHDHAPLPGDSTVSGGRDGRGHLGFAAQPGLAPFGPDVFTAAGRRGPR